MAEPTPSLAIAAVNASVLDPLASSPEVFKVDAVAVDDRGSVLRFSSYIRTNEPPSYRAKLAAGVETAGIPVAPELSIVCEQLHEFIGQSVVIVPNEQAAVA